MAVLIGRLGLTAECGLRKRGSDHRYLVPLVRFFSWLHRLNSLSPRGPGLSIRKRCSAQWDVMDGQGATPATVAFGRVRVPKVVRLSLPALDVRLYGQTRTDSYRHPYSTPRVCATCGICSAGSPRRRPSHPTAQIFKKLSAPGRSLGAHRLPVGAPTGWGVDGMNIRRGLIACQ